MAAGGAPATSPAPVWRGHSPSFREHLRRPGPHPGPQDVTARSLHAKGDVRQARTPRADIGPGGDWVCLMSWTDPQVPMPPEGYGKFELNVHSNDCFTAGGPEQATSVRPSAAMTASTSSA